MSRILIIVLGSCLIVGCSQRKVEVQSAEPHAALGAASEQPWSGVLESDAHEDVAKGDMLRGTEAGKGTIHVYFDDATGDYIARLNVNLAEAAELVVARGPLQELAEVFSRPSLADLSVAAGPPFMGQSDRSLTFEERILLRRLLAESE